MGKIFPYTLNQREYTERQISRLNDAHYHKPWGKYELTPP